MVDLEGWGQSPWVYVHSAIYDTFSVVVLHRSMVDWRRGWGQSTMCTATYETSAV